MGVKGKKKENNAGKKQRGNPPIRRKVEKKREPLVT